MMRFGEDQRQDVLLVCQNGHVITDRMRHGGDEIPAACDRCGAATLHSCPTCGQDLPGAIVVPGLHPTGLLRPPACCERCGAAFPWTKLVAPAPVPAVTVLEGLLKRMPRVIKQLRFRSGERQPLRIQDETDLDDLLRALLPLHFDDIRPQLRTPSYTPGTRIDLLLAQEKVVVAAKLAGPRLLEAQLVTQLNEDVACYRKRINACHTLVAYVHDPEGVIRDPNILNSAPDTTPGELSLRAVVGQNVGQAF